MVLYIVDAVDADEARCMVDESNDADADFGGTTKDSSWGIEDVTEVADV